MRKAKVYRNRNFAGFLIEEDNNYTFTYDDEYYLDNTQPSLSLTLPKSKKEYHSKYLFPFFFNMLSEGTNRKLQCRQLRIDEKDHFGLLIKTATVDTIGPISIKEA